MNSKILIPSLMALALTACGGGGSSSSPTTGGGNGGGDGDGGGGGETPIESFTVTASVGNGQGEISPSSVQVEEGATADFQVVPANGFEIDSVTGCDGVLAENTYTTGNISNDCEVVAKFSELPQQTATIGVESIDSNDGATTSVDSEGTITITVEGNTSGSVTFDSSYSNYRISNGSTNFVSFTVNANVLEYQALSVNGVQETQFTVNATNSGTDLQQDVIFKVTPADTVTIENGFCFEDYCNGEEPKEVKHNLFNDDRTYTAHYIAVAPAETNLKYKVAPEFGEVESIEVTEDSTKDAFSYEYKMSEQEIVIHNPYNYTDEPLVTYTVTMTNTNGEEATQSVSIMYFNAYASGRFTNFNDSPVALPMQGTETFKVEFENYGSSDSKELYIRSFDMLIPSVVGNVDGSDSCETDTNGNTTLETCDLISMEVNQETDEVTITTQLQSLIDNNRDTFSGGLQLYPYIVVCVTPSAEDFNVEECQDLYIAGMNAFISEYNAQEQAKIDELEQLMPKVRAYFEYDVAIKEMANLLNAQGYISNKVREEFINDIRFLSSPLVQEYNIAMQHIFNINGDTVSSLQDQESTIQTTISNIEYYLQYDDFAEQKAELYNDLITTAGVSDTYGYLDTTSPIFTGDDGQPTRFAYNESYGEIVDGEFVFDNAYRILNLAVQKSKK
tara:strand:+ start:24919 stop:26943 length:2025 start_codon:yes stop_codon:yes gene_type:complete